MTPGNRFGWGIAIMSAGSLLLIGGVAFSATFIGACVGIPMILLGLPLGIWGAIWTHQGNVQRQAATIAAGIRSGLADARRDSSRDMATAIAGAPVTASESQVHASAQSASALEAPTSRRSLTLSCPLCGTSYPSDFNFCTLDGTALSPSQSPSDR